MSKKNVLDGIKVIEVASFVAGPSAAVQLSDFGAEVLKVEPPHGDPWRKGDKTPPLQPSETAYTHMLANRNKKSLALNLKDPKAQQVLYDLVKEADIFLTNSLPHVIADLNIGYDTLKKINPKLIYALITGFGEEGAQADSPGFDETAWWARSGLMEQTRGPGAPVTLAPVGMGDNNTSVALFAACMSGLYQRERTGKGCKVSTSLMASGVWTNSIQIQAALVGAPPQVKTSHRDWLGPLAGSAYTTKDGRGIFIVQLNPRNWPDMCDALGQEALKVDPRFANPMLQYQNHAALTQALDGVFGAMTLAEASAALGKAKTNFSVVQLAEECGSDQQMIDNGLFPEVEGTNGFRTVQSPVSVEGIAKAKPQKAPERVGENTIDELKAIGYSDADIKSLAEAGVIGIPE
jgi:formyl-CoA transferase